MPFYIYAWIGSIVSGLFVIIAKLTSKYSIANPWLFNCLLSIVTLVCVIPFSIYYHAGLPHNWIPILLAAVFSTLFTIFWLFATYALDISTIAPLFNLRGIFAIFIGATFLNEHISNGQFFLIGIIIVAGVFSTIDEKLNPKSFFTKPVAIGILSTLCLAIYTALIKVSLVTDSVWTATLWINIFIVILLTPTIPLFYTDIKKLKIYHVLPIGIMGIFSAISEFAAYIAFGVNLSITSLIMNTPFSMIFAFLFSIFAPKLLEKHPIKIYAIRFLATGIMIYGTMRLTE